jgi:hypothetical protein
MDICRTTEPADVRIDDRVVKCHLYSQPASEPNAMREVQLCE